MSREDVIVDQATPAPSLPKLPRNLYWEIKVTTGPDCHVGVYLKEKCLGLFRTAIEKRGYEYMILKADETLTPERLQQVASLAKKIHDHQFNQEDLIHELGQAFPTAKVTKA